MKKFPVILLSIIFITAFGFLVYYATTRSKGVPTVVEKVERVSLVVPFIETDIDLREGISLDLWDTIPDKEVKLMHQLMVLPWPKAVTPVVSVKAFHNKKDIYFYMSWNDETEDADFKMDKFSDACAVMFPLGKETQPATIMMGFIGKVNIWQWKAKQDRQCWLKKEYENTAYADFYYPFEEEELFPVSKDVPTSAVNDLVAIRVGTVTPKDAQAVVGRGLWQDGTWQVVIKRALSASDPDIDAIFNAGEKRLSAFAVWNGSKGDRGGKKSISDWVELQIK